MISMAISSAEWYSASAVESDTVFCVLDRQCTMDWLYLAMSQVVDRRMTLFPHSEAANPSKPWDPPRRYHSLKIGISSRYPITWCRAAQCDGPADVFEPYPVRLWVRLLPA